MIPESNFSNQNIPETQPKKKILVAILLGLLTFVITPVIAFIIAIPFFFLGKVSGIFNPIGIIAGIFGLRDLGGFFAAQIILIGFFALIGDLGTAMVSRFINRSKKLVVITFVSALIFQVGSVAIFLPPALKKSQQAMQRGIEREKSFGQYAEIGDVTYEVQGVDPGLNFNNPHPEFGDIYSKLKILVPISVSRAGTYQVNAQYSDREIGSTPMKDVTQTFDVGTHIIKIEFLPNESRDYGYSSPKSVGGKAEIQLSYLASQKELFESLKSDNTIDQKALRQFMKDEGIDRRANSKSMVNKFVGRKEVQF